MILLTNSIKSVSEVDCLAVVADAHFKGRVELLNHIRNNLCRSEGCLR